MSERTTFNSPIFGPTRQPTEAEREALREAVANTPVAVFQALSRAMNEIGFLLSIEQKPQRLAPLIAAAPGLLAALMDLRSRFHSACIANGSDAWSADAACRNADAAIARASGAKE